MQLDMFAPAPWRAPPTVLEPAAPPPAPADDGFTGVDALVNLVRRYQPTTHRAGECATLNPAAWRTAAEAYQRLMARWLVTPIAGRPLPKPAGTVLEHLHKLDIFRVEMRPGGVPVVLLHVVQAAAEAARRLRPQPEPEEGSVCP